MACLIFKGDPCMVHEAADDAHWRHHRVTTHEFLKRQMETGRRISPIFSVYGVEAYLFRVDWLHAVDQGVGADLAGNVFEELLPKLPGASKLEKCHALNEELQTWYDSMGTPDRLKCLQLKCFKRPKKTQPAKLKGSAAEIRQVMPFVKQMAKKLADPTQPREATMVQCCTHLCHCYQSLSKSSSPVRDEAFYSSSQAFAAHYHALGETGDGVAWRSKPKMHLFLELCSTPGVIPNAFWCYRDEDFGGPIARQCKMRGCWKNLTAYSQHAFDMFFMKNEVPRIVRLT